MEIKDIKELAALMRDMGLFSLEYSEGGSTVKMRRENPRIKTRGAVPDTSAPDIPELTNVVGHDDGQHIVASPMVGVFYAAPAPDKDPYVSIGDKVTAGDVLCIIEAMKMMNEIHAEQSGKITEILASNKQVVEFGQPLFKISL